MTNVDVVMPVRNGAAFIAESLDSILAQTLPPARIIVSDDGSTDATAEIVKSYAARDPRIEFLPSAGHGVSSARNRGIIRSTAEFIAFCDADDLWMPDKLEKQMAVFAAGSRKIGAVHCNYTHINDDGSPRPQDIPVPPKKRGNICLDMLFHQYVLSGSASAAVVRRSALDEAGYFDERLFLGEDADVWIRIAEKYEWDFSPDTLVAIRVHNASAQRRVDRQRDWKYLFQRLILLNKWYGKVEFPASLLPELRQDVARICLRRFFAPPAVIRLYRQLKSSDLRLARDLFPDFRAYSLTLLPLALSAVVGKIKHLIFKVLLSHDHQRTFRRPR